MNRVNYKWLMVNYKLMKSLELKIFVEVITDHHCQFYRRGEF